MIPDKFIRLIAEYGDSENYKAGEVFHAQDFPDKLFILESGYVKRYQATNPELKVLELIYGPSHIISLSQLYKKLFGVDQNKTNYIYIYQAMTDVEVRCISADFVIKELENDPSLFKDFYYESGLKLRSNILRLASNAIKDDYKKVAHQIVSLAEEFGDVTVSESKPQVTILVPLEPIDMAEQLNISVQVAEAVLSSLHQNSLIRMEGNSISIPDINLLKDIYL